MRTTTYPHYPERTQWPSNAYKAEEISDATTKAIPTIPTITTTIPTTTSTTPDYYDELIRNSTDDEYDHEEMTWAEEIAFRKLEYSGYFSVTSPDNFIKNDVS